MPVEFLTDEQAESYGTFGVEPSRPELERFFFLDDEDRRLVDRRRGAHSKLGFALQVCTVRYVGLFSGFGLGRVDVSRVPVNRLATLARYGMASKAAALERAPEPRQTALVTAVCGTWKRPRSTTRWICSRC